METPKNKVLSAIKAGKRTAQDIVPECDMVYSDFCKVLSELLVEGKVKYDPSKGYFPA